MHHRSPGCTRTATDICRDAKRAISDGRRQRPAAHVGERFDRSPIARQPSARSHPCAAR
jgi:hypothetical protein